MKGISFLILILLASSCKVPTSDHGVVSGRFRYSSFTWHHDTGKDSFVLYIASYLDVDSNGKFICMKHHTFMDNARYFSGTINDTLRREIDMLLTSNSYSGNYLFSDTTQIFYDGFTYGFDYQKEDSARKTILFIPKISPPKTQQLYANLESIIASDTVNTIDSFSIASYKAELQSKAIEAGIKIPRSVPPIVRLRKNK